MAKKAPKRNTLKLNLTGFNELITKLDKLDGDVKEAVTDALEQAVESIESDTLNALKKDKLPAKGKYSKGKTKESVIRDAKAVWSGSTAEIAVGFDYGKPGAGGLLITGTPKMQPDYELQKIYKGKKYMKGIQQEMEETIGSYIEDKLEG